MTTNESFASALNGLIGAKPGTSAIHGAQPCGNAVVYRGHFGWYRVPDGISMEAANAWGEEEDQRELARLRA